MTGRACNKNNNQANSNKYSNINNCSSAVLTTTITALKATIKTNSSKYSKSNNCSSAVLATTIIAIKTSTVLNRDL